MSTTSKPDNNAANTAAKSGPQPKGAAQAAEETAKTSESSSKSETPVEVIPSFISRRVWPD